MEIPLIPEERFSDRVIEYVVGRPGYPDSAISWLIATCGLAKSSTVADVGAGTGIFSALLLRHGLNVIAVEPNDAMREAAVTRLGEVRGFRAVAAPAEATTLPDASVDAVVAAQAFHWFNAARFRLECERILKPLGVVSIVWNVRRVETSAFGAGYEELLREFGTDYLAVRHENISEDDLSAFFRGPFERRTFANLQSLDFEGLRARLLSSSYAPAADHPRRGSMLDALDSLFVAHQREGRVAMEYELRAYAGRLSA